MTVTNRKISTAMRNLIKSIKKPLKIGSVKQQVSIIVILALLLIIALGSKIPRLCTVWQLPDEAGYISNAVYFLKQDWGDVRAAMPYYGYGYSVFLMPLFLMGKTGVALIRSAATFNLLCLVIIYFLQIRIMKILYPEGNQAYMAVIAFTTCLSPYLVNHVLGISAEVLLALWVWIIANLLYITIKSNKMVYYFLLAVCSAYIFFIHTRAVVILGTVFLTLFITGIRYHRKDIIKKAVASILILGGAFGILYMFKTSILNDASLLRLEKGEETIIGNLLTTTFFSERLLVFFNPQNIIRFLLGGAARLFYTAYATGVMALYGIITLFKSVVKDQKNNEMNQEMIAAKGVKFYFLSSAVLMITACVVGSYGLSDNWAYCFYGRYFEYTIIPLMCVGIYDCFFGKQSYIRNVCAALVVLILGLATAHISVFLENTDVAIDTGRAAAFTSAIMLSDDYSYMILYAVLILVLLIVLKGICIKYHDMKWVYLGMIILFLLRSDIFNINHIMNIHDGAKEDAELAATVIMQPDSKNVYMLETPFRYDVYYSRMQVLIKSRKLNVITMDNIGEIPAESYVLTYYDAVLEENVINELEFCQKGNVFMLYRKK